MMSADTEAGPLDAESARAVFRRWYHVPVIVGVVVFMLWVRVQNYGAYLGDGIQLQAVDSWYHWRMTNWTVEQFPWLPGFDPWSGFPEGAFAAQFGTLFDWLAALISFVIGLGSPTEGDVFLAALFTVPVLAALAALPVYYLGKTVGGRVGGLAGIVFLALAPGTFLQRTTVGSFDHNGAEPLFMAVAVVGLVAAIKVAERERPVWELVTAGDWDALQRPVLYSALAGVLMTLYIWMWPPAVVLIGIFGSYLVIKLVVDFLHGQSPDHVALVGIVSMIVVAVLTLTRIQEPNFSATALGYLHPTLALLIAAGTAFMAWLARQWEQYEYDRVGYPAAIAAAILVALGGMWLLLPDLYTTLISNLAGRLTPIGYSPGQLTIAEAQPPRDPTNFMFRQYGLAFYAGLLGLVGLFATPLLNREQRGGWLFLAVWSLFLISMGLTQIRFNYYTILAIAVLNAYLVGLVVDWIDISASLEGLREIETYQVLTVGVVILLLLAPLFPPIAQASAITVGAANGPSTDAQKWQPANDWLANNTPEVGNYAGAGNADQLAYYGSYDRPADGDYEYPEGAYGVLSWWDYGHLVTVQGERIPHSNPFQQNARSSAAFFTAQNESQAEFYLDAIAAGASPTHEADEAALQQQIDQNGAEEEIQYVMIDDETAAGKFSAITQWTGPNYGTYLDSQSITIPAPDGSTTNETLRVHSDTYDDTMVSKLYVQDTQGLEHYRLVNESPEYSLVGFQLAQLRNGELIGQATSTPLNIDGYDQNLAQNLSAYRQQNVAYAGRFYDPRLVSSVKTFERVEGATIQGQTDLGANATVVVQVPLQTGTNRSFSYTQRVSSDEIAADGSFDVTVPYPTTEQLGPADGYADSSVRATEDYTVQAFNRTGGIELAQNVSVPETAVQNGETIDVELEPFDPQASVGTDAAGS